MTHTVHARIDGALVMIGFGSIGRGTLPLIERHIGFDPARFTVIEPSDEFAHLLHDHGIRHVQVALTADNFAEVLRGLFPDGRGMIVNLSVDVDSIELMKLAQEIGVPRFLMVGNKVLGDNDLAFIAEHSDDMPLAGYFPVDDRVSLADREGIPVYDAVPEFVAIAQRIAAQI